MKFCLRKRKTFCLLPFVEDRMQILFLVLKRWPFLKAVIWGDDWEEKVWCPGWDSLLRNTFPPFIDRYQSIDLSLSLSIYLPFCSVSIFVFRSIYLHFYDFLLIFFLSFCLSACTDTSLLFIHFLFSFIFLFLLYFINLCFSVWTHICLRSKKLLVM